LKWRSKDQSRFNIFKLPKTWSVLIWRKNRSFRRPSRRQRSATRAASTTAAARFFSGLLDSSPKDV
jgi:hypothetical protein